MSKVKVNFVLISESGHDYFRMGSRSYLFFNLQESRNPTWASFSLTDKREEFVESISAAHCACSNKRKSVRIFCARHVEIHGWLADELNRVALLSLGAGLVWHGDAIESAHFFLRSDTECMKDRGNCYFTFFFFSLFSRAEILSHFAPLPSLCCYFYRHTELNKYAPRRVMHCVANCGILIWS